ncbi:non-ribosomal peptide synthetase [Streptomyces sp. NPDC047071]|uniref:non-ribosomal peptide synthetase n=1 Tax=Streptomyces sp. NPDC047071 TaxID=3154808 RepID=UPI003451979A
MTPRTTKAAAMPDTDSARTPADPGPGPHEDPVLRFLREADRAPDRPAVRDGHRCLSFGELKDRSARLADVLAGHGVRRGTLVGVRLPRSVDLVVALLAVWRAGGAYVPLDPGYPAERLAHMTRDADLRLVVTDRPDPAPQQGVRPVTVDERAPDTAARRPEATHTPDDPAYVIYTSGSTGRPKGVVVSRGGVAHLIAALEHGGLYADAPRTVGWNASVSFDASVQQWTRVCRGDTLVLIDDRLRSEPAAFAAHVRDHGVTDLDVTPSHWQVLSDLLLERPGPTPLRLFVGGEPIPTPLWRDLALAAERGLVEAVNVYGPTETTVDATAAWITGDRPHLGLPLHGVRGQVLDGQLRPVPDGTEGELFLAGAGVAQAYLGRPALTAERFLPDPAAAAPPGSRMYRTGDRVRRRADGTLDYLGRTDRQVKLHGFRIEPGEIETVLADHPDVAAAAVTADTARGLSAYCTLAHGPATADAPERTAARLLRHLAATLPPYLVPSRLTVLPDMPLTANGKLDHAALPAAADRARAARPADEDGHLEPTGPVEPLIARTWAEVLGRDRVRADDDFFVLGGHSLMALKVIAGLKRSLGVVISTRAVYQHPQLRELARHVEDLLADRP